MRSVKSIAVLAAMTPALLEAEEIGEIGVDWLGNDVIVEAFADPKVAGVTCHLAYFERGLIDRLQQGNWFEDPSNSAISCKQTGPIDLGDIDQSGKAENVFSERRSIVFKSVRVKRMYDKANQTLIYISHGSDISQGSAKMAISTIPLFDAGG